MRRMQSTMTVAGALLAGAILFGSACDEPRPEAGLVTTKDSAIAPDSAAARDSIQSVGAGASSDSAAAVAVAQGLGERLANVSLLAPNAQVAGRMRQEYAAFVTPQLMSSWLSDPSSAPGREVSSPWPERLEVREVTRLDEDRYRILGDVVYVTSATAAPSAKAQRERVALVVTRIDDGEWRIAEWHVE